MFETIVKQGAFSERRIIALCWTGCVIAAIRSYSHMHYCVVYVNDS